MEKSNITKIEAIENAIVKEQGNYSGLIEIARNLDQFLKTLPPDCIKIAKRRIEMVFEKYE